MYIYVRTLFASFHQKLKLLKVSIQVIQVAPAKIFWSLKILLATGNTGSTQKEMANHWKFTVIWRLQGVSCRVLHRYFQRVNFTPVLEWNNRAKLGLKCTPKRSWFNSTKSNYTLSSLIFKCTDFARVHFTLPAEKYNMLELILLLSPVCEPVYWSKVYLTYYET